MNRLIIIGIGAVLLMAGCQAPTASSPAAATPTVESPTVAKLTGTWAETSPSVSSVSSSSGSGIESRTNRYTFAADLTVSRFETIVTTPTGGSPTTTYYEDKGTYSIDGNTVNVVFTQYRTPTSANDTNMPWSTSTQNSTLGMYTVFYDGKLYGLQQQVYVAQGTVSGLVGTWVASLYNGTYYKYVVTFSQDTSEFSYYSSATTTFPTTASGTSTYSYTATASTITEGGQTQYYVLFSSHLALGTDASAGAYTKQ